MEVEIVIAELMKLFDVKSITPSQYAKAVQLLLRLRVPFYVNVPRLTDTEKQAHP